MGALKLPTKFAITTANKFLCRRMGVRFNGEIRPNDVAAYEHDANNMGWIRLHNSENTVLHGKVEPFWKDMRS